MLYIDTCTETRVLLSSLKTKIQLLKVTDVSAFQGVVEKNKNNAEDF